MHGRMQAGYAAEQASWTSNIYLEQATRKLCDELDIDRRKPGWQGQLAPFAPVLAAMIAAAAADMHDAVSSGVVENTMAAAVTDAIRTFDPDSLVNEIMNRLA